MLRMAFFISYKTLPNMTDNHPWEIDELKLHNWIIPFHFNSDENKFNQFNLKVTYQGTLNFSL